MNIISWNVNGIRAVERKEELEKFLSTNDPDIFLIQETKSKKEQVQSIIEKYDHYHQFYNSAEKPGYSGTSVWAKKSIVSNPVFSTEFPNFNDTEGRIARLDFDDVVILGVYFPNGGKSPEAWNQKIIFYDCFLSYINTLRGEGKKVIWTGDVNCAHEEIDLARPKDNQNSIGFLPQERAWISRVVEQGWVDVFRSKYPQEIAYSWWHLISNSRARNVGWRIDYFFLDKALFPRVEDIKYLNDQMGSDHCPIQLKIKL